jgi:hypothetical protein
MSIFHGHNARCPRIVEQRIQAIGSATPLTERCGSADQVQKYSGVAPVTSAVATNAGCTDACSARTSSARPLSNLPP